MTQERQNGGAKAGETSPEPARPRVARGLSAKLLLLTIVFVMVGEVLIYVPSISNFRVTWLRERLAAAQIASLVLEATPDQMVSDDLKRELLNNAQAKAVALRRGAARRLVLRTSEPLDIDRHYDLRSTMRVEWIWDAFETLAAGNGRTIRVIDNARHEAGEFIDVVIDETPLRKAMIVYSTNILKLSIILSVLVAAFIFFTLQWFLVRPMRRFTRNMIGFSRNPEDPDRIVTPSGRQDELGLAEQELARMQRDLADMLHQKNRLAALGLAVSKISHDLRNMLTNAQLISDRLSTVEDPTVKRLAPKLLTSIDRAIDFCARTLKYGRAEEAPPRREHVGLSEVVADVFEAVGALGDTPSGMVWTNAVPADLTVDADREHLFRVLMNLCRNAAQALELGPAAGERSSRVKVAARRDGHMVTIEVSDNGPGVPDRAREHLFQAFQGSVRPGGTGLGLAIAAELTLAHGGEISLADSETGATFVATFPDRAIGVDIREKTLKSA